MKITVVGSGRWGSFIAWYLDRIGKDVTVYGKPDSVEFKKLTLTRSNDYIIYPESIKLTTDINILKNVPKNVMCISGFLGCEIIKKYDYPF